MGDQDGILETWVRATGDQGGILETGVRATGDHCSIQLWSSITTLYHVSICLSLPSGILGFIYPS